VGRILGEEVNNEPIIHEKLHLIEASARSDNAYYLRHCPIVERGPSYASCLSRIDDILAGRVNERTAQCQRAYEANACISKGMREQEVIAGSALFYFPRPAGKPFLPVAVAGDFGVMITNHTDPALYTPVKSTPKPKIEVVDTGGFADALNAALTELAEPEAIPVPSPVAIPVPSPVAIPVPSPVASAGPAPGDMPIDRMVAALPIPMPPEPIKTATTTRPPINPGETPLQYARRLASLKTST
jgi:hypothetical protein